MGHHFIVLPGAPVATRTALWIVQQAAKCAGLAKPTTIENLADEETQQILAFVNEIRQEIYDIIGEERFSHAEYLAEIVVGQQDYTIPDGFQGMRARPIIGDVKLTYKTMEQVRRLFVDPEGEGVPAYFSHESGAFVLTPAPSQAFMAGRLVTHGGNYYVCIKQHTAGADDDEPGVGANTALYWLQTASSTTTEAWASGSRYRVGRLSVPYFSTPVLLAANGDTPLLTPEFYPALIVGACWRMKDFLGRSDAEIARAERRYMTLFNDRLAKKRVAFDPPQLEPKDLSS